MRPLERTKCSSVVRVSPSLKETMMMPGMYANDAWMRSLSADAKSCVSTRWEGAPNVRNALASRRMNFFRLSKAGISPSVKERKEGEGESQREERRGLEGSRLCTVLYARARLFAD